MTGLLAASVGPRSVRRPHPVKPTHRASTKVTTASGTTITGTIPGSPAIAGDMGVIFLSAESANTPTTPSGWTLFQKVVDPTGLAQNQTSCCLFLYWKFLVAGDLGASVTFSGMTSKPMQVVIVAYADGGGISTRPNVFFNGATQVNYNVPQHSAATKAGPYDLVVGAVSMGGYISGAKTVTAAPTGATLRQTGGDGSGTPARGIGVWDMPSPT